MSKFLAIVFSVVVVVLCMNAASPQQAALAVPTTLDVPVYAAVVTPVAPVSTAPTICTGPTCPAPLVVATVECGVDAAADSDGVERGKPVRKLVRRSVVVVKAPLVALKVSRRLVSKVRCRSCQ